MGQTTLKQRQIVGGLDGWTPISSFGDYTFVLGTADDPSFHIEWDDGMSLLSYIGVGMKIKWTQNGTVRYGFITYADANGGLTYTEMVVYGGTDYNVDNTTTYPVSNICISREKSPYGFPMSPAKWTVEKLDTSRRQQANPSNLTWYNLGTTNCQLSIPIGVWNVSYGVQVGASGGGVATDISVYVTLSTANNSEVSKRHTASHYSRYLSNGGGGTALNAYLGRDFVLTLTSKTLYYLNGSVYATTAQPDLSFFGNDNTTVISATCAYL